jgi:hypothetical protein
MNNVQKGEHLLAAILAGASTPHGFAIADRPKYTSFDVTQNRCNALANAGALFKVKPPAGYVRYFTTEAAMQLFRAGFPAREVLAAAKKRTLGLRVTRKPYSPPAPRYNAEIVHTADTRYTTTTWIDSRAVTVPYQRIGAAGWSMSI